ncbi:hypothetical protein KUTeg_021641 [Tegillarca granosa]|uniref:Uncharacterized protein n=1 Tax=Tegillarca granosa TaxID=220873 RepID=A0ABQ9E8B0_TEGGR|nr:hypothetical protein KUTeg_021641 [Tegillarca granosa]
MFITRRVYFKNCNEILICSKSMKSDKREFNRLTYRTGDGLTIEMLSDCIKSPLSSSSSSSSSFFSSYNHRFSQWIILFVEI